MSDALGTDKIRARVHAKYGGFGWVVFDEFRDATGFASQCAADVVALGMYESRGVAQLLNSRYDSSLMNLHDRIEDAEQHARIAAESLARQLSAINEFVATHPEVKP